MCRARSGFEPADTWRARLADEIQSSLTELGRR